MCFPTAQPICRRGPLSHNGMVHNCGDGSLLTELPPAQQAAGDMVCITLQTSQIHAFTRY
jgi:hypothetical protein